MKFVNPNYKLHDDNIFRIRQQEFDSLVPIAREMLKPAEELGFEVVEFEFKDPKFSLGELNKTLKKNLVIKMQKGGHPIDLTMSIPKLVDGNYFVINGRRKIPFFQLFDIPIVTRGKSIKLRTNVATIVVFENKSFPLIDISMLGKKVPLALLLFAYFGTDVIIDRFNILEEIPQDEELYTRLQKDLKSYYDDFKTYTQDDFIKDVGKYYSKLDAKTKGEDVIYAVDLILKADVSSARFFTHDNVLDELVAVIKGETSYDDLDFNNKRIRCFEYIALARIAKAVFDLCISNRTARQPKFNVNSQGIISECNVSDIVQFDFAINPIQELTNLSRTSLVGPGGFNKQNVPQHLRDINDTMFGRICPVDTPDRDNCGVLQSLIPNSKFDEKMQFTEQQLVKQPISIPVSMVPFLEHDDQTRLQMSSSQMRQAIMLKNFSEPFVKSGCEQLYTQETQFVKTAKYDGEVVYVNNKYIIVQYITGEIDIFDIEYRKIYTDNLDFYKIYVKVSDKFRRGDILAESNFCKQGEINFGRNLLTAVMVYYGYNYEDGIVISDRVVNEDLFSSLHYNDLSFTIHPNKVLLSLDENKYKPLPEVDQIDQAVELIKQGDPYAILKELPVSSTDFRSIFNEQDCLLAKKNLIVTDFKIYANDWNTDIPEYNDWVEGQLARQEEKEGTLKKLLLDNLPKAEATQYIKDKNIDMTSHVGKYKIKGEKINGIHVELSALYTRQLKVGDKIGNRHGNKGVISRIVPHEKMPRLPDGRNVDICINPLGIISRMNIGQLFELHLGMAIWDLRENAKKMLVNGASQDEVKKYIIDFIDLIDATDTKWVSTQFNTQIPDEVTDKWIDTVCAIQAPFESCDLNAIREALKYTDSQFKYKVHDPIANQEVVNPVAVGEMYFFRMVHIAESKLAARGIGSYQRKTMQPLAGRRNKGGQRCGEMESACLIAQDAPVNLFEFFTTKSDCIDLKNDYIREVIDSSTVTLDKRSDSDIVPESVKILNAYLTVIGIDR